jgi:hypothetical protein
MSDTTSRVEQGRRRHEREHGDPRTREFAAADVRGSAIEQGRAKFAARAGNRSAADAIAAAHNDDQGVGLPPSPPPPGRTQGIGPPGQLACSKIPDRSRHGRR